MRSLFVSIIALMAVVSACKQGNGNNTGNAEGNADEMATLSNETTAQPTFTLEGNTLHWGDHSYTLDDGLRLDGDLPSSDKSQACTVTFTHFPASLEEFRTLQEQLLGRSFGGTLALNLMAYEMFRRDREAGKEAIKMCNTSANASATINQLGQKFSRTRFDADDHDTYHQPYLIASFLKGATQTNKYQPEYPYELRFQWSANPYSKQHDRSDMSYGYLYRLVTQRNGDKECEASVLLSDDEEDFLQVWNAPSYYYAVPNIKKWDDTLK